MSSASLPLLVAFVVASATALGCAAQHTNIIGQPDLTQEELDAAKAEAKADPSAKPSEGTDQAELDVAAKPPPPEKKAPRPRKMDAPKPLAKKGKIPPPPPSPLSTN